MATNLAPKTIQIPEGALDELFIGRIDLMVREDLKIKMQHMGGHGFNAQKIPENMITVPANWFQRAAWNGKTQRKTKNIPVNTYLNRVHRQAFGRESNFLMISRQGWYSNSQRFKANYEGWLANPNTKKTYRMPAVPTPWTDIETWAQIMFNEFDQATQNYVNKKLTPIEP